MTEEKRQQVKKFWAEFRDDRHGQNRIRQLGWADGESLTKRYRAIIDALPTDVCTVIDIGCGEADLLPILLMRGLAAKYYYGVDIDEKLLSLNKEIYPTANFSTDMPRTCGWVIENGIFNQAWEKDEALKEIEDIFQHWIAFEHGFIGTFSSDRTEEKYRNDWTLYWKPSELVALFESLCFRGRIEIDHSYAPNDFLIKVTRR